MRPLLSFNPWCLEPLKGRLDKLFMMSVGLVEDLSAGDGLAIEMMAMGKTRAYRDSTISYTILMTVMSKYMKYIIYVCRSYVKSRTTPCIFCWNYPSKLDLQIWINILLVSQVTHHSSVVDTKWSYGVRSIHRNMIILLNILFEDMWFW